MSNIKDIKIQFQKDIANHEISIMSDDRISSRVIKFSNPNSSEQHMYVMTAPNNICISGDMGSFVFCNHNTDMLAWFNGNEDLRYKREKLRAGHAYKYCVDTARQSIREIVQSFCEDHFDQIFLHDNCYNTEEIQELWELGLLEQVEDGINYANEDAFYSSAYQIEIEINDDITFKIDCDDDIACKQYTYRFIWAVLALNHIAKLYFDNYSKDENHV